MAVTNFDAGPKSGRRTRDRRQQLQPVSADWTAPSTAELARRISRGQKIKFLFFWGHHRQRDGSIGPGCLSQWWPAPFVVDGTRFATAEHYMMWAKALLFDDATVAERVLAAGHPQQAKALGRQVRGFDEQAWAEHRYAIVVAGSVFKFSQHADLRAFLLGTGQRVLAEDSPIDRVWGIGLTADDERASSPDRWPGLNLLGFALMQARRTLGHPEG
jgi:ribA/ribD-fused uncharacterized protein